MIGRAWPGHKIIISIPFALRSGARDASALRRKPEGRESATMRNLRRSCGCGFVAGKAVVGDVNVADDRQKKACWKPPMATASQPKSGGITAPPKLPMLMMPEPSLVSDPSSAMPRAKMVGYMMELARPHRIRLQTATVPVVLIANSIRATPKNPRPASSTFARIFFIATVPANLPSMMANI